MASARGVAFCHPGAKRSKNITRLRSQTPPHTSLVLVSRKRARVRFARPSMFIVPRKLVFMVLMGLYLPRKGRGEHAGGVPGRVEMLSQALGARTRHKEVMQ